MTIETHPLQRFFFPRSVAIVGATNNPFKMNYRILENLVKLNFQGTLYPVNLNSREILGIKAYPTIESIPHNVDLAVSAIPANRTIEIVKQCAKKNIGSVVIVTGGFSEGGPQGQRLHTELSSFVKQHEIRVLGPNTLSPINTTNNLIVSFNPVKKITRGTVSLAFQSGFYEPRLNWIFSHMGVSKILDMGNKMDLNEVDALTYFGQDPDTRVIGLHLESIKGDPSEFFQVLKSITPHKPVVILKAGRTVAGAKAAASHTGSMAQENAPIFSSLIKQAGAIQANNIDEFFDFTKAFAFLDLPSGNRVSIITLSGGEGVMATDACEAHGLKLAQLSRLTHDQLKEIFPPWEIPLNPFDAGVCMEFHLSDLKGFFERFSSIPQDTNVDCILMQMPPNFSYFMSSMHEVSQEMALAMTEEYLDLLSTMKKPGKPFAMWNAAMVKEEMGLIEKMGQRKLAVFSSAERAIRALSVLYTYKRYRDRRVHG